jgi:hypothetical protein
VCRVLGCRGHSVSLGLEMDGASLNAWETAQLADQRILAVHKDLQGHAMSTAKIRHDWAWKLVCAWNIASRMFARAQNRSRSRSRSQTQNRSRSQTQNRSRSHSRSRSRSRTHTRGCSCRGLWNASLHPPRYAFASDGYYRRPSSRIATTAFSVAVLAPEDCITTGTCRALKSHWCAVGQFLRACGR